MAVLIANDRPPRKATEPRRYDAAGPHHVPLSPTAERPALVEHAPRTERDPEPGH